MSQSSHKSSIEQLSTPVQFLKGVGPDRAELLHRLELKNARDILFFFPRDYEDMSELRSISELEEEQPVSVCGVVEEIELRNLSPGRSMLGVLIREGNQFLRAVWFNQPYMRQKFYQGNRVLLSGTPRMKGFRWEMMHPKVAQMGQEEAPPLGRILPVYPLTEGISQPQMRRIVQGVVEGFAQLLEEVMPENFLDEHRLWPIRAALPQIHIPSDPESLVQARRRFVYQELLVLQLALAFRRVKRTTQRRAPSMPLTPLIDSRILRLFPFEPTADQKKSMADIAADMGRSVPMNRLLQGDVGSGKTFVAQYAMLLAVAHGYQAALMAPTEVLARQHARTLEKSLAQSKVRIGLLTGSVTANERARLLSEIAAGRIDLIVGTHAVIHAVARSETQFSKLGLVVIDEQHKFGVRERATLRQAGIDPHYLVMTATPIPRTVSMLLFGDLDVSTIRTLPPGRQPAHTYFVGDDKRERWWDFFRKKLREGRQGYVITPLVEDATVEEDELQLIEDFDEQQPQPNLHGKEEALPESEEAEVIVPRKPVASVAAAYEMLVNGPLAEFRVDLIHGRMTASAKDAAMEKFRKGETQVLVATSVIEVGVDVPNASVMTIESGERFGLAQLHQLRGRVGRGGHAGYVCVFADPASDGSRERLEAFTSTTDGFELAELDFQLRGPGDLFSTRQHGLPPLRIANLQRDAEIVQEARRAAQSLTAVDPELQAPEFARLRRMVMVRYGEALELGDVG